MGKACEMFSRTICCVMRRNKFEGRYRPEKLKNGVLVDDFQLRNLTGLYAAV